MGVIHETGSSADVHRITLCSKGGGGGGHATFGILKSLFLIRCGLSTSKIKFKKCKNYIPKILNPKNAVFN